MYLPFSLQSSGFQTSGPASAEHFLHRIRVCCRNLLNRVLFSMFLVIVFVIFSQLVAEIKSDAIQFDIVFVDCPNNLTEFLVIVFGLLLSICDQKDPFPVFLGAYKTAQHIHPNNHIISHFCIGDMNVEVYESLLMHFQDCKF